MATLSLVDWRDPAARRWTLLAALYVFTVCTTLRLPGLPVGVGEAGLVATGLAALTLHWRQLAPTLAAYRWLVIFLLVYVTLLVVGGLASARAGRLSPGWAHDVAALLFASGTGFLFLLLAGASPVAVQRLQRGIVWVAAALSGLAFLLIVGDYLLGRPVFSPALQANLWWHGRFSAWAMDPNQWGLLLLVAIMLLAMLPGRLSVLLLAVLVWLLLEVRSDAALAGLLAFALVYAGVSLWRRPDARRGALTALAVIVLVFGCFRLVSDHFPPSPVLRVVGAIAGVEPPVHTLKKRQRMRQEGNPVFIGAGGDKLGHRLALWRHSIEAWRVSPVVGLGPGAYSGPQRPFQGQESHNLLMQVLVNTGAAGLLAALAGLSALGLLIWRSPATAPWLAVLAGLLAQGMGHYLMRHPLFWLCIALLCWQAVYGRSNAETTEEATKACPDY